MKISTKFLLAFLIIGIIFAILGIIFLLESRHTLLNEAFNHLKSVREIKKAQIEYFFSERQDHLHMLLEVVATFKQNTTQKLQSIQANKKAQLEWYFSERLNDVEILSKGEFITQAMNQFIAAFNHQAQNVAKPIWQSEAAKFDTELRRYMKAYKYDDLLLISKNGDIVYTVTRDLKIGQNLFQKTLKDTYLTRSFQKGLQRVSIQDFAPCALMDNQYVGFLAAPVFSADELIGVVILRLSLASINAMIQRREGMGKTEETYLVGLLDGHISYRSNRVTTGTEQCMIGYEIHGEDINKALAGQTGTLVKINQGNLELSSYAPLQLLDLNWGIITTISLEEAITPIRKLAGEQEDFFTRYIHQYGYYDLFLIHPEGTIFYTVKHKADYATNILTGTYANSTLGNLIREVLQTEMFGVGDYAPYAPSYNDPHLFVAQPVFNSDDEIELIVALQLSDDILDEILLKRAGMGKSGETYLVGSDKRMRSNSFLDLDNHSIKASFANPLMGSVNTASSHAALSGKTGEHIITNYLEQPVLSAYTPLKVGNTTWALIAEISEDEAFAALRTLEWLLGIITFLVGLGTVFLILRFTKQLLTPLLQVNEHLKFLAQGKLIEGDDVIYQGKDEIAEIITSFYQLKNSVKSTIEQANAIAAGDYTREVKLLSQQDQLGIALSDMTHTLHSQSQKLQKQQEELRQVNDELEQRVIRRTHQLARANQEITALNELLKAENRRMGTELEVTRQLQQMVLPKHKELEKIKDLDIVGFMEPADEVGGDYYDVLVHDGHIVCGIGDVTGHGLESGVVMLMVQTAVRTLLHTDINSLEAFLSILNRTIYDNIKRMESDKKLTLSLLDYQAGILRLTGQHEDILLVRHNGIVERINTLDLGVMIGMIANITTFVSQLEIPLQHGEGIVLYTDGITEARNLNKEFYGIERLCEIVSDSWQHSASEIQQAIITDVRQHIGKQKMSDDITLLVIKRVVL